MKRIRLRVSVKSATTCTIKRVLRALPTLPRKLKRTLNRGTYSDTLNRSAYSIRLTQRHSSIENPTLNPEAPDNHVEREVGKNFGKLLQLYGIHKAQIEARKKGYTTRRQALSDGSIKLVIGGVR